jgi:dipeptidyl aminopeptidase/acylaminoacyl peptidase
MSTFLARTLIAAALAAGLCTAHAQPAARPPISHFFQHSPFSTPKLSPDATMVAVRVATPRGRDDLAVVNLADGTVTAVAGFNDVDIDDFMWISNQRLVYDTTDRQIDSGQLDGAPGLFAVNRDGSGFKQLVLRQGEDEGVIQGSNSNIKPAPMLKWNHFMLMQAGAQDSEYVYVINPSFDGAEMRDVDLKRLNTLNGRVQSVGRPPYTRRWLLDHKGEPRIAVALERDMRTVHYRDPATSEWRVLVSYNILNDKSGEAFTPLAFGPDGTLYVETLAGKDKRAVHTFNFATGRVNPQARIDADDYDFDGELIFNRDKLLGMRMITDAESTMWFDARMKAVQDAVDALLPATANLISVAERAQTPNVLVESFSDVSPPSFMVYNTETKVFRKIGSSKPQIDPTQMGKQQAVRYKARDGLVIPALLTLPANSHGKNLPLVVLVHGGPYVRGASWGWKADTQFLASRGYAVLEPEFRGSTGFGDAHFRAGWKQWGLAMQNDIADGARWAIGQGIVDPKRICIAGASYGGYAALMGVMNDPDLFKCGINWVGVTDINLLYDGKWYRQDISDRARRYSMPELVGDQVKDAAQLKATSPLFQAARIKQPLLLAYGGADRRVPSYHGEQFYQAVKAHNKDVEWLYYPVEGHGWMLPKTQDDFWSRVEKFLDRHIGQP